LAGRVGPSDARWVFDPEKSVVGSLYTRSLETMKERRCAMSVMDGGASGNAEVDGYDLLRTLRERGEIASTYPVNPVAVARVMGVQVFVGWLDPRVSATLIKEPGKDPVIMLNNSDSENRRRFSCAHEIGHYIRRAGPDDEDYAFIDFRDENSSSGLHQDEIYANQFAASLLMPQPAVRELREKGLGPVQMAIAFGVSPEAMRYRLENFDNLVAVG
jgi:IrrE N-terminal-like domain